MRQTRQAGPRARAIGLLECDYCKLTAYHDPPGPLFPPSAAASARGRGLVPAAPCAPRPRPMTDGADGEGGPRSQISLIALSEMGRNLVPDVAGTEIASPDALRRRDGIIAGDTSSGTVAVTTLVAEWKAS